MAKRDGRTDSAAVVPGSMAILGVSPSFAVFKVPIQEGYGCPQLGVVHPAGNDTCGAGMVESFAGDDRELDADAEQPGNRARTKASYR